MAEVMDLDLSLEEIAKRRGGANGNKRGRGRGGAGGSNGGRAASSLKRDSPRAVPYVSNSFIHSSPQQYYVDSWAIFEK